MRFKHGVKLADLKPQMALGAVVVRDVYAALDPNCSCTMTSANDSKHGDGSLHYYGKALDFRTHDFSGDKARLRAEVKDALGPDFDVVLEGVGTPNEHLHVEWDPK